MDKELQPESEEENLDTLEHLDREDTIIVSRGRIPSPSDEVLLDFGKDLIKLSVTQSVEFHKTMLGLTATFTTLMASIFGILAFGVKDQQLGSFQRIFLVIPVILMLLSSTCFAFGYYPRIVKVNLRVLNSIEKARDKLIKTRKMFALCGIVLFNLAILSLLVGVIYLNAK